MLKIFWPLAALVALSCSSPPLDDEVPAGDLSAGAEGAAIGGQTGSGGLSAAGAAGEHPATAGAPTGGIGGQAIISGGCECLQVLDPSCGPCVYYDCTAINYPSHTCDTTNAAYRTSDNEWFGYDRFNTASRAQALENAKDHCACHAPDPGGYGGQGGGGGEGDGGGSGSPAEPYCSVSALEFCHEQGIEGSWLCATTETGGYCEACPEGDLDCNSDPVDGCEVTAAFCP